MLYRIKLIPGTECINLHLQQLPVKSSFTKYNFVLHQKEASA
jgi:hypothetical protein